MSPPPQPIPCRPPEPPKHSKTHLDHDGFVHLVGYYNAYQGITRRLGSLQEAVLPFF